MPTARRRWTLAAPLAASALFSTIFVARTAFIVDGRRYFTLFDDAMISMRYARNFAEGKGLAWNAGQPAVEGYTNFLWTLWMAVLHVLPWSEATISLGVMISGAALIGVEVVLVQRIAAHLAPPPSRAPIVAAWLTAAYYPLAYWTLRGMEVGLVTVLVSAAVLFSLRLSERYRTQDVIVLAVIAAAGVLTRPDVLVPCAVVAAFAVWTSRPGDRRIVASLLFGAIGATFALHTAFRVSYYGDPLPNTYYLKVYGAPLSARLARGARGLAVAATLHLLVPIAFAAAYLNVYARKCATEIAAAARGPYLLGTLFVAACAYSAYVGGDAWDSMLYANRYVTPAVPPLLVLAALTLDGLASGAFSPRSTFAVAGLFLLAGALTAVSPIVTQGLTATPADERLKIVRVLLTCAPVVVLPLLPRARVPGLAILTLSSIVAINGLALALWLDHNAFYADDDAWTTRYGLALRAATRDDATIAVTWAGAIPYFSHRNTIDLLGKSDRAVARAPRQASAGFDPGHDKWDYDYSIGRLRPDVVAQMWHASEAERAAVARAGYVAVAPWAYVRADSTRVDRAAVRTVACDILRADPFVLGSTMRAPAHGEDLVAAYCRE